MGCFISKGDLGDNGIRHLLASKRLGDGSERPLIGISNGCVNSLSIKAIQFMSFVAESLFD
jgi:hypothetical protein